jgi:hypothetical protein
VTEKVRSRCVHDSLANRIVRSVSRERFSRLFHV